MDVDEFEEGLEAADDLGHAEDDDLDDEEDDDADEEDLADEGPDRDAAARHRSLQLIGVDFRARSNPAPGRQVLTPEGARKYGLPIGSTILPGMRALTAAQQAAVAGLSDEDRPKYLQARREGATHAAAMKAAGGAPSRKSTARRPSEIQGPERKTLAADVVKRYESARRTGRSHAEAVDEIALALSEPGRDGQRDLTPAGARALVRDLLRENGVTTTTPAKKATPAVANKADIQIFPSRWGKGKVVVARYADGTTARIADDIPDAAVRRLMADIAAAPNPAARVAEIRAEFDAFATARFARSEAITRLARENDIPNWRTLNVARQEAALRRRGIEVPPPVGPAPFTTAPRKAVTAKAAKKAAPARPVFDASRAQTFRSTGVPRTAELRQGPATIRAEWGEDQHFSGDWYAVLDEQGRVRYGAAAREWRAQNELIPGTNQWRKSATVDAYQHRGAQRRVTTVLADGTVETTQTARSGDWIVRQANGEVQVITDVEFRRLYDVPAPVKAAKKAAAPAKAAKRVPAKATATGPVRSGPDALRSGQMDLSDVPSASRAQGATTAEIDAVHMYAGDAQRINALIRQGRTGSRAIAGLDSLMARSSLTSDVELWRGLRTGDMFPSLADDLTGFQWTEQAYFSTTASRRVAEQFAGTFRDPQPVLLRVRAPAGTPAITVSPWGESALPILAGRGQAEVLLGRGARLRVVADEGWQQVDGVPVPVRILDVEVIPAAAPAKKAVPRAAKAAPAVLDAPASPAPSAPPSPDIPVGEGAELGSLSLDQLLSLARERGITIPPRASREDILRLLRGEVPEVATSFSATDIAERVGEHIRRSVSTGLASIDEAAIRDELAGLTVPQLRRVAREFGMVGPDTVGAPPAGTRAPGWLDWMIARWLDDARTPRGAWRSVEPALRHRTLQLLGIETRADVNPKPGDNDLRNYWVYGKGRAKWNTFTELRRHLLEHVGPERADRIAAQWFHLRYGFWPGDDRNRVRQGKPPRGNRIGPG